MFGAASGYQPKSGSSAPKNTPRGGSAGKKEPEVKFLGDVQRLEMKPDDILVLQVDQIVSAEMAKRLKAQVTEIVGADRKVMVLDKGVKLGVLSPR